MMVPPALRLLLSVAALASVSAAQIPGPTLRGPVPDPAHFQSPFFANAIATLQDPAGTTTGILTVGDSFSPSFSTSTLELREPAGGLRWSLQPSAEFGAYYGARFVGLPDVDGDGVQDVLMGRSIDEGAQVLSGASGSRIDYLTSPTPLLGGGFGNRVTSLGDLDGDGAVEFTVEGYTGLALYRMVGGAATFVTFFPGIHAALLPGPGSTGELVVNDSFDTAFLTLSGSALTEVRSYPQILHRGLTMGDVTGDGRDDFAMFTGIDISVVDGTDLSLLWFRDGSGDTLTTGFSADGAFGLWFATGQDLNGDGVQDLAVGDAYHKASSPLSDEGAIYIYDGTNGAELGVLFGVQGMAGLGIELAMASSFLGNGTPCVLSGLNRPFGYGFPSEHPGEIRSYTLAPPAVAPAPAPVLQVDRVHDLYTVSGAKPVSLGFLGASLGTTTFAGLTVVDVLDPAKKLLFVPVLFDANGVTQAALPVPVFPQFHLQVMDDRGFLTEITTWEFF